MRRAPPRDARLSVRVFYQAWRQSVRRESDTPPDGLGGQR